MSPKFLIDLFCAPALENFMSPKFLIDLFCAPALENSENMYGLSVKEKDVQFGSRKFHSTIEKIYSILLL